MKYKVMCNGIPMSMRSMEDIYYKTDGFLLFDSVATEFEYILEATQAVEQTILIAMAHGYEKYWGIFRGYSVVPCGEQESA